MKYELHGMMTIRPIKRHEKMTPDLFFRGQNLSK